MFYSVLVIVFINIISKQIWHLTEETKFKSRGSHQTTTELMYQMCQCIKFA